MDKALKTKREDVIQIFEELTQEIFELRENNKYLSAIKNDLIEFSLKKDEEFPKDWEKMRQKEATLRVYYEDKIKEYVDILKKMQESHKNEVRILKFDIEMLQKQIPKKKSFFDGFL